MSQGVYVLGGKCPGGKCPGGKCPGGICPWGKCPGGTCPGGLCPRTPSGSLHEPVFFVGIADLGLTIDSFSDSDQGRFFNISL